MALDPVLLAEACIGIHPDKWQRDVLRSTSRRVLLNCCRQSGKSTTVAIRALHTALYVPGSLTLLISPSERQSIELARKVFGMYRALDRPVPAEAFSKLTLELDNGSRIVALPGGNEAGIRGYSPNLVIIDEASRVDDMLYRSSVRPMLAVSQGSLIVLSTPAGKRGFFWEAWEEGRAFEKVKITALDCPRISAEFLAEERVTLGETFYQSEYFCSFEANLFSLFDPLDIEAAFTPGLKALAW